LYLKYVARAGQGRLGRAHEAAAWAARTFGPLHAAAIAAVLEGHYRLNIIARPEHLDHGRAASIPRAPKAVVTKPGRGSIGSPHSLLPPHGKLFLALRVSRIF
jgi:hypothetical protein